MPVYTLSLALQTLGIEKHSSRIFFLPMELISAQKGEIASAGHPSLKGQRRAADVLKQFITEKIMNKDNET